MMHTTLRERSIPSVSVDPVIAHVDSLIAKTKAFEEICALDIQRSEPLRYEAAETAYLDAGDLAFHTPATTLEGLLAQARLIAAEVAEPGGDTGHDNFNAFLQNLPGIIERMTVPAV